MSIEAGVVVSDGGSPIFWHVPYDRSGGALPDSRTLWDVLWENRGIVRGFAHSHPGSGEPYPSSTDTSTFKAIEAALGRRLDWWIVSSDSIVLYRWAEDVGEYKWVERGWASTAVHRRASEPCWAEELRERSNYSEQARG